jgi:hypothetical protein
MDCPVSDSRKVYSNRRKLIETLGAIAALPLLKASAQYDFSMEAN